jgi:Ala-tRNA(Pro) deacylase
MAIPAPIARFLETRKIDYSVVPHPTAYTAQEEAAVAHVPGREWAKVVVCFADEKPILAVLPAPYSVDFERLRELAGAGALRLAQEPEIEPLYPGCERGAMPPLGPLYEQSVYVDRSLAADPEIVFNGGTHADAIRMSYQSFADLVRPVVGEFAIRPGVAGDGR